MDQLTLKQYQQLFSQATAKSDQSEVNPRLLERLIPGGTLTPPDALNVYATGHIVRLTEALGETFEAVWWVCGDEDFFKLAKHYILANPSTTYNLSFFGKEFPIFLDQVLPFPDLPFLGDLARFEWLFKELFHTGQHGSVAPDRIQSLTEDAFTSFRIGQAVRLFTSRYAVYDLWQMRGTSHDGTPPAEWDRSQSLLLYKNHKQIFVKEVGEAEYAILTALRNGESIETALTGVVDTYPDFSQDQIAQLFQMIFYTGIIEKVVSDSHT